MFHPMAETALGCSASDPSANRSLGSARKTFGSGPEVSMLTCQEHIRTVMLSSRDAKIVELWLEKYPSPHTRYCYSLDSERLLNHAKKPLARITLADLQSFAQALTSSGLAPISGARSLAAVKFLCACCH